MSQFSVLFVFFILNLSMPLIRSYRSFLDRIGHEIDYRCKNTTVICRGRYVLLLPIMIYSMYISNIGGLIRRGRLLLLSLLLLLYYMIIRLGFLLLRLLSLNLNSEAYRGTLIRLLLRYHSVLLGLLSLTYSFDLSILRLYLSY